MICERRIYETNPPTPLSPHDLACRLRWRWTYPRATDRTYATDGTPDHTGRTTDYAYAARSAADYTPNHTF